MELATRIYDTVLRSENIHPQIASILPDDTGQHYWRRVLRMAALCHDIGHIPFSHAGEKALLPTDWDHERLTVELIHSEEMRAIWNAMEPQLDPAHIAALATSTMPIADVKSRLWQLVLREIIVGDAFGADRMDFLLRDSLHTGVAYGHFDHHRLIDTLRILPEPQVDEVDDDRPPALGLEEGGIYTAEALLLARYFMYQQVYFHHVRRAYDIHLIDFLRDWLIDGYPIDLSRHLAMTDNIVLAAIRKRAVTTRHAA
jgi:HD superfamily phosphohydrolase